MTSFFCNVWEERKPGAKAPVCAASNAGLKPGSSTEIAGESDVAVNADAEAEDDFAHGGILDVRGKDNCVSLDVEVTNVECVLFDELAAGFDVFAHQCGEDALALGNVFEFDR
jgi:hypothetical protein